MNKKVLLKDLVSTGTHIRKTVVPKTVLSDNGQFAPGEFWDANTIAKFVMTYIGSGAGGTIITGEIPANAVGSEQIADGSVGLEDLSDEVKDKMKVTVDEEDENVNFNQLFGI